MLTVEEAKGLEFYSVLVFPEGMSNNELYVAFTRALHELTVIT
ncbi:ATP-binding domain-containing protein [Faecalibaculum rodentium]